MLRGYDRVHMAELEVTPDVPEYHSYLCRIQPLIWQRMGSWLVDLSVVPDEIHSDDKRGWYLHLSYRLRTVRAEQLDHAYVDRMLGEFTDEWDKHDYVLITRATATSLREMLRRVAGTEVLP